MTYKSILLEYEYLTNHNTKLEKILPYLLEIVGYNLEILCFDFLMGEALMGLLHIEIQAPLGRLGHCGGFYQFFVW